VNQLMVNIGLECQNCGGNAFEIFTLQGR